jgi:hypothetical protein
MASRTAIVCSTSKYHTPNSLLLKIKIKKKKKLPKEAGFMPIVGSIPAKVADVQVPSIVADASQSH